MNEDHNLETLAHQRTPPVIAIDVVEFLSLSVFFHLGFHVILCVCVGFSVSYYTPLFWCVD